MNKTLNLGGRLLSLEVPRVMGILNITPDSFYDGGRYLNEKDILHHAQKMLVEGATFLDIGGYSSRPGADDIPQEEELRRIRPAIRAIIREFPDTLIAIDTFRAKVGTAAVGEGAVMVIVITSGCLDPALSQAVARLGVPIIAMHMRGTPKTMNTLTTYGHLLTDVVSYFHEKIHGFHGLGIRDIIIDPGFGFAKTVGHNFTLLDQLETLRILGKPIMVGLSRKSTIWRTLQTTAEHALNGTTCLNTIALLRGASILRVHDVREAVETITLVSTMQSSRKIYLPIPRLP